jgi:BirA family biotin operon repressor/biotin-[acetyl-CoA-carboxylase] ligase
MNLPADAAALIDVSRLKAQLGAAACRFDVDTVSVCTSTNSELLARPNLASGTVLVADTQTAGRGRRGRSWISDTAASLTFSLFWRFHRPPAAMAGLSLAVGVAVARGLTPFCPDLRLKWPNDLLRPHAGQWGKLGGILVETVADAESCAAVIGIGINLAAPTQVSSALPATGLGEESAAQPDRLEVLAAMLVELPGVLDQFDADGFAPFVAAWQALNAYHGVPVNIEEGGRMLGTGRCTGVDRDGALLLEHDGKLVRWLSGDLSLRPA